MEKEIGSEAKLKAEVVAGKIKFSVEYDGKQVDATATISSDVDALCDALATVIPGDSALETGAIAILRTALKAVVI